MIMWSHDEKRELDGAYARGGCDKMSIMLCFGS